MSGEAQSFLDELQSEVFERSSGNDGSAPDFKENVFTEYVMELLAGEVGIVESPEACHFLKEINRGQAKISGFAIDEDAQDGESIDLFLSVYKGFADVTAVPAAEMKKAAEQAVRFFGGALDNLYTKLDPSQPQYRMAKRINEVGPRLKHARLFILTDGQTDLALQKPATIPVKDTPIQLRMEFWDVERLSRVIGSGKPQSEIEIDLLAMNGGPLPCVTTASPEDEYSAFVTIIPGQLLFKMYDEHGATLLQRNVRSFLQARGNVNKGIRDSLKQQPGRFLAYNNGISLTADRVEVTGSGAAVAITRIRGLQIVNGGQTTVSIHQAGKAKVDLSRVYVQAKLTVLKAELVDTLAPMIAKYANTQNPIQMADFSANDPFHIEFERLSKDTWTPDGQARWYYERTRGQYFVEQNKLGKGTTKEKRFLEATPKHRKLDKLDIAKYLSAWEQHPDQVSLGGQKNFVKFTQKLFESRAKTWKPDERFYKDTIAKAILFREASRLVAGTRHREIKSQLAAYVVATMALRTGGQIDLLHIWQHQRLSLALENLISEWTSPIGEEIATVGQQHSMGAGEWAKKLECWKGVQRLVLPFPDTLPPEFEKVQRAGAAWGVAPTETRVALDPDEMDARGRCRELEPADWIRILDWGTQSGTLDSKQREIAAEIAACAATGWQKAPASKKVLTGREVINLAIEAGVFEEAPAA